MLAVRRLTTLAALLLSISTPVLASEQLTPAEKKFVKGFGDRVGRIWYAKLEANKDRIVPGTVCVRFSISRGGKLMNLRILSNTSNQLAAQLAVDAIRRAKIPPMPSEANYGWIYSPPYFDFVVYEK
jgi:TonB family protein